MAAQPTNTGIPGALQLPLTELPTRRAQGRVRRTLKITVPAALLVLIFFLCFLWPLIYAVPSPTFTNILDSNLPVFSKGHFLGTDSVGYDVWSRILYGGRTSLEIALAVNAIGLVIGGLFGALAGYVGGIRDAVMMRFIDVLIAFPAIVLALAIAERLGPSEFHVILALSVFGIPAVGRIARGATLTIRGLPFMTAARLAGTRRWRIIARHVVPNIMPNIVTFSLLGLGVVIILEGALDFLGYGIQLPEASWGSMIAAGQQVLTAQPEYVLIPSIALVITVVALNTLGDALRERWGVQ